MLPGLQKTELRLDGGGVPEVLLGLVEESRKSLDSRQEAFHPRRELRGVGRKLRDEERAVPQEIVVIKRIPVERPQGGQQEQGGLAVLHQEVPVHLGADAQAAPIDAGELLLKAPVGPDHLLDGGRAEVFHHAVVLVIAVDRGRGGRHPQRLVHVALGEIVELPVGVGAAGAAGRDGVDQTQSEEGEDARNQDGPRRGEATDHDEGSSR